MRNNAVSARNMAQEGRMLVVSKHSAPGTARRVKEIARFFERWPGEDGGVLEKAGVRKGIMKALAEAESVFADERKGAKAELALLRAKSAFYSLGGLAVLAAGAVWSFTLNWPSYIRGVPALERINEAQMANELSLAASAAAEVGALALGVFMIAKHVALSIMARRMKEDLRKVEDFIRRTKTFLNEAWAEELGKKGAA